MTNDVSASGYERASSNCVITFCYVDSLHDGSQLTIGWSKVYVEPTSVDLALDVLMGIGCKLVGTQVHQVMKLMLVY